MDTSLMIDFDRLYFKKLLIMYSGLECMPIQLPLTKIFVIAGICSKLIRSIGITPSSSKRYCSISDDPLPTVTTVMRAKFLTRPMLYPSGDSAGQTTPQCVLCRCLGLAIFPVLLNGVCILLKCDNVAK